MVGDGRVCVSPIQSHLTSAAQVAHSTADDSVAYCAGVADTALVSPVAINVNRLASPSPMVSHATGRSSRTFASAFVEQRSSISGLAHLEQRLSARGLSQGAAALVTDRFAPSTKKHYNSAFKKWVGWCGRRRLDPHSPTVTLFANFLADLHSEGLQYRSINLIRASVAAVLASFSPVALSTDPIVSSLMKGIFRSRPPQSRYSAFWDVATVLNFWRSQGESSTLSLRLLTFKLATLLSLCSPQRCSELVQLSLDFMLLAGNQCVFTVPGMTKTRRLGAPLSFTLEAFPDDSLVCPFVCLRAFLAATDVVRGDERRLFISFRKPHRGVCSATAARWLLSSLSLSGIDTSIFKAHSIRGASASSAKASGVSPKQIMEAAHWSDKSDTFFRFYNRPLLTAISPSTYAKAVLSRSALFFAALNVPML